MNLMDYSHILETEIVASNDECAYMFLIFLKLPLQLSCSLDYLVLRSLLLEWCWHACQLYLLAFWKALSLLNHKFTRHPQKCDHGHTVNVQSFFSGNINNWDLITLQRSTSTKMDGRLAAWETSWKLMLPVPLASLSSCWGSKQVKGWTARPCQ